MLGVFVDMSYTPGLYSQPCPQSEPGFGCPGALGKSAVQPRSHGSYVSSGRLQLSCFKLGVQVLLILHQIDVLHGKQSLFMKDVRREERI